LILGFILQGSSEVLNIRKSGNEKTERS
jgi:hypothetical protein